MDNEIDSKARVSKKFFIIAIVILAIVSVIVGAALSANKSDDGSKTSEVVDAQISQIIDTKEVVTKGEIDFTDFSTKVEEISEALDKIEPELKEEQTKAKFEEIKKSFVKLKESGEMAKLVADASQGVNEDVLAKLKANEKLKAVGESLGEYQKKVKEFKEKYAGNGDDMQAVFDYSELEKASENVKAEVAKLKDRELTEATSDEINAFYDKIEELREIISK